MSVAFGNVKKNCYAITHIPSNEIAITALFCFHTRQLLYLYHAKCRHCSSLSQFQPISVLPAVRWSEFCTIKMLHISMHRHLDFVLVILHIQDVLLYVTDKWLRAIDESKYTRSRAVFSGLEVPLYFNPCKGILLSKSKPFGFEGASYELLCDYLSDRHQKVLFHGT